MGATSPPRPPKMTSSELFGVVLRSVAASRRRAQVVRRQVDHLLQVAADVDDRRLHLTWRRDVLVQEVAAQHRLVLGARPDRTEGRDAVQGLAVTGAVAGTVARQPSGRPARRAVAAGEDASVVAEDRVLADAARDPVVAPAADDLVVVGVTVGHVVAAAEVDEVVAQPTVDLVVAEDLPPAVAALELAAERIERLCRIRRVEQIGDVLVDGAAAVLGLGSGIAAGACGARSEETVGSEVGATRRVVEKFDATYEDLAASPVHVVVDVRDVVLAGIAPDRGARRAAIREFPGQAVTTVGADDADDLAVVADDRVGVECVTVARDGGAGCQTAVVVAVAVQAAVAEDDVGTVRPLVRRDQ